MADIGSQMEQTRLLAVLFLLVLKTGVLIISSTLNTTIAHKTKFFRMMRCIEMSKEQIICFVGLEALNWCKTAIQ